MGLEMLKSRSDKAKLKWWYKLATTPRDRYPKQLFGQEWNLKPRRGRQRKTLSMVFDDVFLLLGLDKCEWFDNAMQLHLPFSYIPLSSTLFKCTSQAPSQAKSIYT